jgi:excisionase family DNA binding protein
MDKILTVDDVAEILHVKPITVREMFREKRLRAFKMGKAWRTTEQMLQEDIDAIAHQVIGSSAAVSAADPAPEARPAADVEAPPDVVKKPRARRKRAVSPEDEGGLVPPDNGNETEAELPESKPEDTQGLLF